MQIRNDSSSSLVSRARRGVLKAACGLAMASGLAFSSLAHAAYPDKTIQVIISFPPAGSTDVLARAVTQRMSQVLGQSIVVENRAGAGGAIGLTAGARAQPDGYGLYLAATTNQAIAANIYKNQAAHLIKDFEPIGLIGFVPHVLVVPAQLPVKSVPCHTLSPNFLSHATSSISPTFLTRAVPRRCPAWSVVTRS
jgi:tripartite-type tricarboxylate transporter receptor subunit TctC